MKNRIHAYLLEQFPGVVALHSWGETAFFFNPGLTRPRGVYFVTLKDKDGPHDKASQLNRAGVYRLNIGLTREHYQQLFGALPARPPKAGVVSTGHDFSALDVITPHPVYGWMGWISVINPGETTFARLQPLLHAAYQQAAARYEKLRPRQSRAPA